MDVPPESTTVGGWFRSKLQTAFAAQRAL